MRRFASSVLLLGCACFFPADRGRVLEGRVDSLADENKQLKKDLENATAKLEQTTTRLQQALDQLDTASRTTGANIGVKVDAAIQDIASLHGQLESGQVKVNELEQKLAALEARPAGKADAKDEPTPKKEELKKPDDPKEFLKLAEEKTKGGDVEQARRLFAEFLKKWPRDELAGEAHFAWGETFFNDSKCREALYEYGKVIQDHPKAKSAPVAYLRSADCFKELKMTPEAKLALEEVQKQYPKSDAAKTAKQKLADLAKPAPKTEKKK